MNTLFEIARLVPLILALSLGLAAIEIWAERRKRKAAELQKGLTFERYDGATTTVDCALCRNCKNYWWVQNAEFEPPKFCCYCGNEFTRMVEVPSGEMAKDQVL